MLPYTLINYGMVAKRWLKLSFYNPVLPTLQTNYYSYISAYRSLFSLQRISSSSSGPDELAAISTIGLVKI